MLSIRDEDSDAKISCSKSPLPTPKFYAEPYFSSKKVIFKFIVDMLLLLNIYDAFSYRTFLLEIVHYAVIGATGESSSVGSSKKCKFHNLGSLCCFLLLPEKYL